MKAKEKEKLKTHSVDELRAELAQTREKHFRAKFKNGVSPLANVMEIRQLRRHAARLETWIRQKETAGAVSAASKPAAGRTEKKPR